MRIGGENMANSSAREAVSGWENPRDIDVGNEPGLTYRLDLQPGSELLTTLPHHRLQKLKWLLP